MAGTPPFKAALMLACALVPVAAAAQQDTTALSIELNALDPVEGACRISFVVVNGHAQDIDAAVFEAVLFDQSGRVDRLTLFDFGALPAARTRVRQFIVPELDCAGVGRVLFNGAETCETGAGAGVCTDGLRVSSRLTVEVAG